MNDFEPAQLQMTFQHIFKQEGTEISNMGLIIHRGTAGVQGYYARLQGLKEFLRARQGIIKSESHGSFSLFVKTVGQSAPKWHAEWRQSE